MLDQALPQPAQVEKPGNYFTRYGIRPDAAGNQEVYLGQLITR